MLGDAGISNDDLVVVYGSGESPRETELAFWVLNYLGHEVRRGPDSRCQALKGGTVLAGGENANSKYIKLSKI